MLCQMQLKADDRMATVPCGRPDAALVRTACPRMGHVENVFLCRRCLRTVIYCQPCFEQDRMMVRTSLIALAG